MYCMELFFLEELWLTGKASEKLTFPSELNGRHYLDDTSGNRETRIKGR